MIRNHRNLEYMVFQNDFFENFKSLGIATYCFCEKYKLVMYIE
jgi:hypothetical protein